MTYKTDTERLAEFVVTAGQSDFRESARAKLKRNVLDSVACAVGALDGELIPAIRAHAEQFSGRPTATFVGGGRASVDQAAFFNAVLVRYPDLLDTYLTPGGLCHPADNFGAVLAVAEHVDAGGTDFLLALAIAYEVQCRFSAQVPVMGRGLNHALQLAISAAAGSAKLLGLDAAQPPTPSRRPRWTTCRWPLCTPSRFRRGRASRRRSPACAPSMPRCSRAAGSPAREPFRGAQRPGAAARPANRLAYIRPFADRRRADLSQAVLLAHSRSGDHRRDVVTARRARPSPPPTSRR